MIFNYYSADINECVTGAASCAPDATCMNTLPPGGFECRCNEGFVGDGQLLAQLCWVSTDDPAISKKSFSQY